MAKPKTTDKVVCRNRKVRHEYHIETTYEAGLVLVGSEVKSLRQGKADLTDAYAVYRNGELILEGLHIAPYDNASHFNHDAKRSRTLLMAKREIERLGVKIKERGFALVPLEIYFKDGWAKVLLGLGKGRKQHDNRQEIKAKQERREMRDAAEKKDSR